MMAIGTGLLLGREIDDWNSEAIGSQIFPDRWDCKKIGSGIEISQC